MSSPKVGSFPSSHCHADPCSLAKLAQRMLHLITAALGEGGREGKPRPLHMRKAVLSRPVPLSSHPPGRAKPHLPEHRPPLCISFCRDTWLSGQHLNQGCSVPASGPYRPLRSASVFPKKSAAPYSGPPDTCQYVPAESPVYGGTRL